MGKKIHQLKISIIISNYQGRKFLPRCLTHLMNQTYKNYEVIFVDAGSTDGSVQYVRENFPEITLIECDKIGIGEAINIGIKKSSGDIISFDFNTDEYVFPNWLEEMVKHLEMYEYKIVAGTTRLIYGTQLIDEAGVKINFFGHGRKLGHKQDISTFIFEKKPVVQVSSPTFHRNLLKKIGEVDEEYYIYAEDLDFCYRAKLIGIEIYCAPMARSHHQISATTKTNIKRYEYFLRRAQIRFQLIYFSPWRLIFSLFYICLFLPGSTIARMIIFPAKFDFVSEKLNGKLKAIHWNLINLKKTLRRRKEIYIWKNSQ